MHGDVFDLISSFITKRKKTKHGRICEIYFEELSASHLISQKNVTFKSMWNLFYKTV